MDPHVASQVDAIADRIAAAPGVTAVMLLGSAARGELAAAAVDGRLELFSDLEFMVVTARRLPGEARRAISADVERMAAGFGYRSRLFHVDLLFRERARLRSLPPFVFTFELAANGRPLRGPDVRPLIRRVTLSNLDRRNTREILMKRLWALAEALPADWIGGRLPLPEVTARTLGVALCRNALDVPTVLLPDAGILLPTYAERVRHWCDVPGRPFRPVVDGALGMDSGRYLARCLAARGRADASAAPADDHARLLRWIAGALIVVADAGMGRDVAPARAEVAMADTDVAMTQAGTAIASPGVIAAKSGDTAIVAAFAADLIARTSRRVFNERPISPGEWLAVARQSVRIANTLGGRRAVDWLRRPRKGDLCAGLLLLHLALAQRGDGADGDAGAREVLAAAAERLAPIAAGPDDWRGAILRAPDFERAWLAGRVLAGRAFWRVIRLGDEGAWRRIADAIGAADTI